MATHDERLVEAANALARHCASEMTNGFRRHNGTKSIVEPPTTAFATREKIAANSITWRRKGPGGPTGLQIPFRMPQQITQGSVASKIVDFCESTLPWITLIEVEVGTQRAVRFDSEVESKFSPRARNSYRFRSAILCVR
jgi:hypothetical protein